MIKVITKSRENLKMSLKQRHRGHKTSYYCLRTSLDFNSVPLPRSWWRWDHSKLLENRQLPKRPTPSGASRWEHQQQTCSCWHPQWLPAAVVLVRRSSRPSPHPAPWKAPRTPADLLTRPECGGALNQPWADERCYHLMLNSIWVTQHLNKISDRQRLHLLLLFTLF